MKKFKNKLSHAIVGVSYAWRTQSSFRIIVCFGVITSILNVVLNLSPENIIGVMLLVALIYALEMMNTAVEKLCDFIYPAPNPNIKLVKDLAAGAVFLACFFAFVFGILIYGEAIIKIIKGGE